MAGLRRPGAGLRNLALTLGVLAAAAAAAGGWFYGRLRASLPELDGVARLAGLSAPVRVERDALGVPTITGANRADVARALGYLHAQDRFFSMDVMRRRAAGELSELFGRGALPLDRGARRFGFRSIAREALKGIGPEERAVAEAYTAGVNAGLSALHAKPFEYYVLREDPAPWRPEDCALIDSAMTLTLQEDDGAYERTLAALRDTYGQAGLSFFAPLLTPRDAALDGSTAPQSAIPGPTVIDLRRKPSTQGAVARLSPIEVSLMSAGSNSLAVSGAHTASGAAILANDMHLDLGVPNVWYRASLVWGAHRVTGVTLPGAPVVVAGSNGRVAWGMTNSYADCADVVPVPLSAEEGFYHGPGSSGLIEFETHRESIRIHGGKTEVQEYPWTVWGPVIGKDADGRPLAYRWTALMPAAINFKLLEMETAATAQDAISVAHRLGIPAQNVLIADASGKIAWTIGGSLPNRVGFDGRLPVSWIYGDRRWDGLLPPDRFPVFDPPGQATLWTANQRIVGPPQIATLGDSGYSHPARAAQIRDDLADLVGRKHTGIAPADLLAIQLDDRARFLDRWRDLMVRTLSAANARPGSDRAELAAAVQGCELRADIDSTAYRLVRDFRIAVCRLVLGPIFAPCTEAYPDFQPARLDVEGSVWTLLAEQPAHLLNPRFVQWGDLLLAAADEVGAGLKREGLRPAQATWGRQNRLNIRHVFAQILPEWLTPWLNMPVEPVPGGEDMPRIQRPSFGASERFAVEPGHEETGIFEMPCGESGHPLSPYYRAGHENWVRGAPAPFLPGPAEHTLTLQPGSE